MILVMGIAMAPIPAVAQGASAGSLDPRVRTELEVAREAVWRAYFQGDSSALVRLLPERMTAMRQDRAAIIRDARAFANTGAKYQGIEFTGNEFFVSGDVAIVWSHYVVRLTDRDGKPIPMTGRAIELFVRHNGTWINPHWTLQEK